MSSKAPKTRHSSGTKISDLVGKGKEFVGSEVPTYRAMMQRGLLLQELKYCEQDVDKRNYPVKQIASDLCPLVLDQWRKSNANFIPPVIISEISVIQKIQRFWEKVSDVVWNRVKEKDRKYVMDHLDTLFDLTTCPHKIRLCRDQDSGCENPRHCQVRAHIQCNCPRDKKIPVLELEWMYHQRGKKKELSSMPMAGVDQVETERQNKAAKRKQLEQEASKKRQKKEQERSLQLELQRGEMLLQLNDVGREQEEIVEQEIYKLSIRDQRKEKKEAAILVAWLLKSRLGKHDHLVHRYLNQPVQRRNMMAVPNLATASLRFAVPPAAAAAIATGYLQDLIAGGHINPDLAYLACDPNKVRRARQEAMTMARAIDEEKYLGVKITGLGYDGRKDPQTRAMVPDSKGKPHLRMIREEHVSVTDEPSGKYLWHFVPEEPVHPEKPALKVAQELYDLLVSYDSVDSLLVLMGDSTAMNTGWKGGTHALLEKMINRKLFWGICMIHTNELPLRHLIIGLDGPTSSDTGFTGPVCSLLGKVNTMTYNSEFKAVLGGEDLIKIPEAVLVKMSTDQQLSYRLVQAVKSGYLPPELQEVQCGKICHARWLTTGQRLIYMWTRNHGLTGKDQATLETLVRFCLSYYFKLYFEIKVHHRLEHGPLHILTQLRILRTQPKKVKDIVTYYIRSGAWYVHPECVLLSLVSSESREDRQFAVSKILNLRGGNEFGDIAVRPRITPKMNLMATTLQKLISWEPDKIHEPVFTCSLSQDQIKEIIEKPFEVPQYSLHTQSTERVVKAVTEAAAVVVGQQARDGFIRARAHHRESMPSFRSKKDIMNTF